MKKRIEKNKKIVRKINISKTSKLISIVAAIIIILMFYILFLENNLLSVYEKRLEYKTLPDNFDSLKIIHIAELRYYKDNYKTKKLIKYINEIKPDIIFISGKLNLDKFNKDQLDKNLSKLHARLAKYYIGDDKDFLLSKNKFINLNNNSDTLYIGNQYINIIGINNFIPENYIKLDNSFTIALIDKADDWDTISKNLKINLGLSSGQGGILGIPFSDKGIIATGDNKKYINGLYKDNNYYVVSSSINNKYAPFRAFNKPSISFIRLAKEK